MKNFLKHTCKIVISVLFVQIFLIGLFVVISRSYSFKIDKNIHKLIIGHSMLAWAIDDELYPQSFNIADNATEINYSYGKLRKILNENSQIDTVFFGIKPDDVTQNLNDISGSAYILSKVPTYFFLFTKDDIVKMCQYPSFYVALCRVPFVFFKIHWRNFFHESKLKNYHLGGYHKTSSANLIESNSLFDYDINDTLKINSFYDYYLTKIVDLCQSKDVTLIFMTSPMYNPQPIVNFKNYMLSKHLNYVDYSSFNLPVSSFKDRFHLNTSGAEVFTLKLDSLLNSK